MCLLETLNIHNPSMWTHAQLRHCVTGVSRTLGQAGKDIHTDVDLRTIHHGYSAVGMVPVFWLPWWHYSKSTVCIYCK